MRSVVGVLVFAAGVIAALVFGIWSLMLEVPIVRELAGFGSAIVAVVLFPITMTVVPWYSVAARGDWMPVLVTYGGVGLALAFMGAGSAVVVSHLGSNSGYGKPRRRIAFWRRSER